MKNLYIYAPKVVRKVQNCVVHSNVFLHCGMPYMIDPHEFHDRSYIICTLLSYNIPQTIFIYVYCAGRKCEAQTWEYCSVMSWRV